MPAECCGLLLGPSPAPDAAWSAPTRIAEAVPIPNASGDPNRFFLEPEAYIAERRRARDRGLAVVGFYHSHPHSSPAPSVTDLLEATYPDHLYLIVSLARSSPQIRVFRYCADPQSAGGTFVETAVVRESL